MKQLIVFLKICVSIGLISYLFYQMDWAQFFKALQNFDITQLLPLFCLSFLGILLSVWKWSYLLKILEQPKDYWHLLKVFWIGLFFNNFLPGRTGGDFYRAYELAKTNDARTQTTLSVVVDRLLNLMALGFIGGLGILYGAPLLKFEWTGWHILVLVFVPLLVLSIGFVARHTQIAISIKQSLHLFLSNPIKLLLPLGLALIYQMTMILSHVVVFTGLGQKLELSHFFYLVPITALATLIPISLNGIGLRESAFVVTFTQVGVLSEYALTLSLIITFFTMGLSSVGGILYAINQSKISQSNFHKASL